MLGQKSNFPRFVLDAVCVDPIACRGEILTMASDEFRYGTLRRFPSDANGPERIFTSADHPDDKILSECFIAFHDHLLREKRRSLGGFYMLPSSRTQKGLNMVFRLVDRDEKNNYFSPIPGSERGKVFPAALSWSDKKESEIPCDSIPVSEVFLSFAFRNTSLRPDANPLDKDILRLHSKIKQLETSGVLDDSDSNKRAGSNTCKKCRSHWNRLMELEKQFWEKYERTKASEETHVVGYAEGDEVEQDRIIEAAKAVLRKSKQAASRHPDTLN